MTTKNERMKIYDSVFSFMIENDFRSLPSPLTKVCKRLGIKLVPLSKVTQGSGLRTIQIFKLWKNHNGQLVVHKDTQSNYSFTIMYNDAPNQHDRKSFTIAEELSHIILGHHLDDMYNNVNPTPWNERKYQYHEKCARIAAGVLICPPPVFFDIIPDLLSVGNIQRLCKISQKCAIVRYDMLNKYQSEITEHEKYEALSYLYNDIADEIQCFDCGKRGIEPDTGLCFLCSEYPDWLSSHEFPANFARRDIRVFAEFDMLKMSVD